MKNILKKLFFSLCIGIFFINPLFSIAETAEEFRAQIEAKQAEIQQLEKQIAAYKTEIKNRKAQESTLAKQIANMEIQIKKLESEIKLTQTKISATGLKIQGLTADIMARNAEIEKQNNNLSEIIRTIYIYDQETPLALVLANASFSEFLNQVQFIESLQGNIKVKLDAIKDLKQQMEKQKSDFEAQKNELEDLRSELSGKTIVLGSQKEDKQDLLVTTKSQEKKYQQMLADVQKQREEIQKQIYALEDKLRLQIDFNSVPAFRSGVLEWPLKNIVTQKFGPTSQTGFINDAYNFHNGIDIDAEVGDAVRAAADGIVKAKGDNGKYAYGKWIAIDHENGLITLYAHFSGYAVSVGQKIKAGQVIGYAGNTGFSTGAHLHFTVYAASTFSTQNKWYGTLPLGGAINPMNYL